MADCKLTIEFLKFSGADESIPLTSSLAVLVGPNNSGKSRALREIRQAVTSDARGVVLTEVRRKYEGSAEEAVDWVRRVARPADESESDTTRFVGYKGSAMLTNQVRILWNGRGALASFGEMLVSHVDTEARLQLTKSVDNIDLKSSPPSEPLHGLVLSPSLERRLSEAVHRAFDEEVSVSRTPGNLIHLLLGRPTAEATLDNEEYLDQVRELPLVHDQGDGMRSYIGLLLSALALPVQIALIDEPEAFLHPPQAREIGRQLAEALSGPEDTGTSIKPHQMIVATHSADVLLGLLDSGHELTVIRVRRDGSSNVPAVLASKQLMDLWSDPLLRYSNLLDGLFHEGVVLCESEGDARLYSAALDAATRAAESPSAGLLFSYSGGKQGLPKAISALRGLAVPVAAIADIDVLREQPLLQRIVAALGGEWTEDLARETQIVEAAVSNQPASAPLISDVYTQVEEALGPDRTARLTEGQTRRIREVTKSSDGWKRLKQNGGVDAIGRGQAWSAINSVIETLSKLGLFVLRNGELEQWAPAIGGHGSAFVDAALVSHVHETSAELQGFVGNIVAFLAGSDPAAS